MDRGFAKWAEHVSEPHPPFSLSHRHLKTREDFQRRNILCVDHVTVPVSHFPAFVMAVYSLNLFYIMVCIYKVHVGVVLTSGALHFSSLHKPSFYQRHLAELTQRLNIVYGIDAVNSSAEAVNETSTEVSGLVAVYVHEMEQWCRATVINSSPDDPSQVKVQLLDYGVLMSLPQSSVQPLK